MASKFAAVIEETRALAKIVTVDSTSPIKKADFVELAHIGGWQCVVKKGDFQPGDKAIYVEIDALLPITEPAFAFLSERKEGLKTFDDVVYSRIRSIKLRGELSQGLLIPVPAQFKSEPVGTNLTNRMNVRKWEEVIVNNDGLDGRLNAESNGWIDRFIKLIAGKPAPSQFKAWPSQLSKSDQERVQNIGNQYAQAANEEELFEETVKLDGKSMTVFDIWVDNEPQRGVCSRNYQLSMTDIVFTKEQAIRRFVAQNLFGLVSGTRSLIRSVKQVVKSVKAKELTVVDGVKELLGRKYFWFAGLKFRIAARDEDVVAFALDEDLVKRLTTYNTTHNDRVSVQGELVGPGIAKNYEKIDEVEFFVYQVYRDGNRKVLPDEARRITEALGLKYVPVLGTDITLPKSVKEVLARAKGKGALNPEVKREGIVFKSTTRDFSFKVISNEYLLQKEKELEAEEA